MLPRSKRLSRRTFPQSRGGRSVEYSFGTIRTHSSEDFRVAVVVSKKVFPRAVLRNRAKRRIFEAISRSALRTEPARSFIIYAKRAALTEPFAEIVNAVSSAAR